METLRLKRIVKNYLIDYMRNKYYNVQKNHLLFAFPRGGSTWLMEIIQYITKEPVIWEPLHLGHKCPAFKTLNFGWRQYIPEEIEWNEAKLAFDSLFSGKLIDEDIFRHSTYMQSFKSKSLLFKFIFGTQLLPWLTENYTFCYKPINLIRHPFAVVSSQLRHNSWSFPVSSYTIPSIPFNDIFYKYESFLNTLSTAEEVFTADWCLANKYVLEHKNNNIKWLTVSYEELVINPQKTLNRIIKEWGLDKDISKIDFKKNSSTTKKDSPENGISRINHWQRKLSIHQIRRMKKVLEYFEINTYSADRAEPKGIYN